MEKKYSKRKTELKIFYQSRLDKVVNSLGGKKFSNIYFAEEMNVSRERARQIIKYYDLVVPKCDYQSSEQFKDLKRLVDSGEIVNFTHDQLYKDRYKEFLPKDLIRGFVSYSGKGFSVTKNGVLNEFFSKVKTEGKELEEIFYELQSMYPMKKHNYWSFCMDIFNRGLPYKKKRNHKLREREIIASDKLAKASGELLAFIEVHKLDCQFYSSSQLLELFNLGRKEKLDRGLFRKVILRNGIVVAKTKSFALVNRLTSLNLNFKDHSFEEVVRIHNEKFPIFQVSKRVLYSYYYFPLMEK